MLDILYFIFVCTAVYIMLSLLLTYLVHRFPRVPISHTPDWGHITDTCIPTPDGGHLEVWVVEPEEPSEGVILFAHGWGSNRDTMVKRAKVFARLGYTAVMHSSRDHGSSSSKKIVSAIHFAEDIETVLKWVDKPVILYGYSAGAAGSILVAKHYPNLVRVLFLEACFAETDEALLSFYRYGNRLFGTLFGHVVVFWLKVLYGKRFKDIHPAAIAPNLKMPVMIIHGEADQQFPLHMAVSLKNSFLEEQTVEMHIAANKDHGESVECSQYAEKVLGFLARIK